jgi:dipeptidyl aminopeptidase/acylaminoacyl peptidase
MKQWSCCAALALIVVVSANANGQENRFSVKDDIEMTRFSDPYPVPGLASSDVARRSPDGHYFVIVTTKGLLRSDLLESTVTAFELEKSKLVLASVSSADRWKHWTIATLTSYPHHSQAYAYPTVIKDVQWSSDSSRIYFRGEDQSGAFRVYEAAVDGSGYHVITPGGSNVVQYDIGTRVLVYRAVNTNEADAESTKAVRSDSQDVTGESLESILFPHELAYLWPHTSTLWTRRVNGTNVTTWEIPNSSLRDRIQSTSMWTPFVASPDGKKLIELEPVASVPKSWEAYKPARGFEERQFRISDPRLTNDNNPLRPKRYVLVDLLTGKRVPLIDGPSGFALTYSQNERVVWSRDGNSVLVTNVFLPLDNLSGPAYEQRLRPCAVARVDIRTLRVSCLIFDSDAQGSVMGGIHLESVAFGENNDEVVLEGDIASQRNVAQRYRYVAGTWKLLSTEPVAGHSRLNESSKEDRSDDVDLVVRQTLNDPPTLWAVNRDTGKGDEIWDPNPQFTHIQLGQVSVYHWKDRTGYEWTGGLVKPVGYVHGKRYPLVLQMYNFVDDEFMTDGTDPTAFAARELASVGFVVLQIQRKPIHTLDDAEVQGHLEGYRSAIEHLAKDGLIDTHKVGVVGFSWTCWYVENALIKAPNMFAAATIADGVDHSYMGYHLFDISSPALEEQDDKIIGAKPFSEGLKKWLEFAPGFHLDQVETPLRIEAINPLSLLGEWEIYSSLAMQNKPVDIIYFPKGTHVHQKPLERFESQQGDVDWMRFWLQGYEDPDPAKETQYERWEHLRELQNAESQVVGQPSNEVIRPN